MNNSTQQQWGRAMPAAEPSPVSQEKHRSSLVEKKIAKAERVAKARMAQLSTLKTVPRPQQGILARVLSSIFG